MVSQLRPKPGDLYYVLPPNLTYSFEPMAYEDEVSEVARTRPEGPWRQATTGTAKQGEAPKVSAIREAIEQAESQQGEPFWAWPYKDGSSTKYGFMAFYDWAVANGLDLNDYITKSGEPDKAAIEQLAQAYGDPQVFAEWLTFWLNRRQGFVARHSAQAKDDPFFDDGRPTRRHQGLVIWAATLDLDKLKAAPRSKGATTAGYVRRDVIMEMPGVLIARAPLRLIEEALHMGPKGMKALGDNVAPLSEEFRPLVQSLIVDGFLELFRRRGNYWTTADMWTYSEPYRAGRIPAIAIQLVYSQIPDVVYRVAQFIACQPDRDLFISLAEQAETLGRRLGINVMDLFPAQHVPQEWQDREPRNLPYTVDQPIRETKPRLFQQQIPRAFLDELIDDQARKANPEAGSTFEIVEWLVRRFEDAVFERTEVSLMQAPSVALGPVSLVLSVRSSSPA